MLFDERFPSLAPSRDHLRPLLHRLAQPVAALLLPLSAGATTITPSGTTSTTVATDNGGHAIVDLAPAQTGVSYNAFRSFDVDAAGATLRNGEVHARTIVAEVQSAAPSSINGTLTLEGPRANLVFANQNGIRVDGGEFVNFGSVALTTGAVQLQDVAISPDLTQRYVRIDTKGSGSIDIGPGGLAAELINLELIARSVKIGGEIDNRYTSPTASVRIVAGESSTLIDTMVSPADNLTPWAHHLGGTAASTAYAVDVTAGAKVTSGRIEVLVTDQGAGVRNAGELLAAVGDFVVNSSGAVEQVGGRIEAAGTVDIDAASFAQSSAMGVPP